MKPMLACDWDESKVAFPVFAQPKIDGVRALNLAGTLTGRSLKKFKNQHVTKLFSHSVCLGFDGEFAAEVETHADLCRLTTSAVGTIKGHPWLRWHLFDYVTHETITLPYVERFRLLMERVVRLQQEFPIIGQHLRVTPTELCVSMEKVEAYEANCLNAGYEGVILRDPNGTYKFGRSTAKEGGLLRIKRFLDSEAVVTAVIEGETNLNEAKTNALGYVERSTHQANMRANGLVGTLICEACEDCGPIKAGDAIMVSPGRMTHGERQHYMAVPNAIIGKTIKFKFFPKGTKDKLRFPTFQSIRISEDQS